MGARAGDLYHKCAAILHTLNLETHGVGHLAAVLDHMVSVTTDMGVELGIGDCQAPTLWRVFRARFGRADQLEADDGGGEATSEAAAAEPGRALIFGSTIPMLGVLHAMGNFTAGVHSAMSGWEKFTAQLATVCIVFCQPGSLERLVQQ